MKYLNADFRLAVIRFYPNNADSKCLKYDQITFNCETSWSGSARKKKKSGKK
jgi:hypothetical protein